MMPLALFTSLLLTLTTPVLAGRGGRKRPSLGDSGGGGGEDNAPLPVYTTTAQPTPTFVRSNVFDDSDDDSDDHFSGRPSTARKIIYIVVAVVAVVLVLLTLVCVCCCIRRRRRNRNAIRNTPKAPKGAMPIGQGEHAIETPPPMYQPQQQGITYGVVVMQPVEGGANTGYYGYAPQGQGQPVTGYR